MPIAEGLPAQTADCPARKHALKAVVSTCWALPTALQRLTLSFELSLAEPSDLVQIDTVHPGE
ncbi:MAG: hypothetical protein IBX68_10430 [Dehalococcoidia bacterium]|nr:hypothetical protein [Dehalococcoidia bacterium]